MTACRHPDTKTDRRLLEETRAGRAESFELLYRRHHAVVLAFLARRTSHPEPPTRWPRGFTRIALSRQLLVDVSFSARLAVTSSRSYYQLDLHFPKSRSCTAGEISGPTLRDVRAGQRISEQELVPYSCPGVYRGTVTYVPDSGPEAPGAPSNPHSVLVGRFSFRVP